MEHSKVYDFLHHHVTKYVSPQFLKFCIVGGLGTITNLAIFTVLVSLLDFNKSVAVAIGFVISAIQNYTLNHFWSFSEKTKDSEMSKEAMIKFFIVALTALGLNLITLDYMIKLFHLTKNYFVFGHAVGIVAGTVLNYLGSKYLIFTGFKFFKYQAAGNDFIVIKTEKFDSQRAVKMCDRNFGIGADGVLIHQKTELDDADVKMKIINADGSQAEMCGNGFRCFIKYLFDIKFINKQHSINVETVKGILKCNLSVSKSKDLIMDVCLGEVSLLKGSGGAQVSGKEIDGMISFGVNVGNPHLVIFNKDHSAIEDTHAKEVSIKHKAPSFFGYEVNVEVLTSIDKSAKKVSLIVNERGAGFTMACGTGGAASIYSLYKNGVVLKNEEWTIAFPGGEVQYRVADNEDVFMKGTASKTFIGEIV